MSASDFKLIQDSIDNPGYGPGTYSIDGPFSTNIFNHGAHDFWSATTVGHVSGHVRGTLTMQQDNTYRFVGSYTLRDTRKTPATVRALPSKSSKQKFWRSRKNSTSIRTTRNSWESRATMPTRMVGGDSI
ncbi:hypothetical protein [Burkholderia ambifaria]|uniref:hypothetical protein n=1 Tax=Burkholderia ambifaria TaxID=152480 RepID=UPI00158D2EAA|nr:hypothetical protein [Burkholderia ambifaria]